MTVAVRQAGHLQSDGDGRSGAVIAGFELFDAFAAAEPAWRQLERGRLLATPYQRFEWLNHWYAYLGRADGAEPLIVAGYDAAGEPAFILPLICERRCGCRVAGFGGGSHSNLNMAVWRADIVAQLTGAGIAALLRDIAAARHIDLFALLGQPPAWAGVRNPFALLAGQRSPDDVFGASLDGATAPFRLRLPGGMRKKERKLKQLPDYRFVTAATPCEVDRILGVFGPQKAARFERQGIHDLFSDAGVMDFIRAACLDGLAEGRPAIELYALDADGEMLAIVGGVSNRQRFSVMFNSITAGAGAKLSPGIILMAEVVAVCVRRGIASFDLGAGQARYKTLFCSGSEQRFDCFVPCSAPGRGLAAASEVAGVVRRKFKNSPALMDALHAVRRLTTAARRCASHAER